LNLSEDKYQESHLIALLNQSSEYAFQLLYDRYRNRIYKVGIQYLKSPTMAQDVVQDVFMKLWFERKQLNGNHPIEAWLYTVAKNQIINQLKKEALGWKILKKNIEVDFEDIEPGIFQKLENTEINTVLQNSLSELPNNQRKVYDLVRVQHYSYSKVGEILNISPLTVKTHMARALKHIRSSIVKSGLINLLIFILL
jgi:RNA polymerase sigma-70 factor (ECF subfamily)